LGPGYTAAESAFVIADAATESPEFCEIVLEDLDFTNDYSRMPDHADPHGAAAEAAGAAKKTRAGQKADGPRKAGRQGTGKKPAKEKGAKEKATAQVSNAKVKKISK